MHIQTLQKGFVNTAIIAKFRKKNQIHHSL